MIILKILILLLLLRKSISEPITLRVLAQSSNGNKGTFNNIINDFNEYSNENDLNINAEFNLLSKANSTDNTSDFISMVETLLLKKNTKYDIFIYDNVYTTKLGKHLLNLNNVLPKNHIEMYNQQILSQTCFYKDKLVGLPVTLENTVLYSNMNLLNKYNKTKPTTWTELLETSEYIMKEERKLNNTDLIAYNGLFPDDEEGLYSTYEFIYSYRDSYNSPFPELTSQASINALKMIKNLKNNIASDEIFSSNSEFTIKKILQGGALFLKYWIFPEFFVYSDYKMGKLPGVKEGISASTIKGVNIGINKYISEEKRIASVEAYEFLTSKYIQKKYSVEHVIVTGIPSLFKDPDICREGNCELFESLQPIGRPIYKSENYDEYIKDFRSNIYEYLYKNASAEEVLKTIDDITRIYYITTDTKDTYVGLISFIFVSFIIFIMIFSSIYLFRENFSPFFNYFSLDFWLIFIIGTVLISSVIYTKFGTLTSFKCSLMSVLFFFGLGLNYIPMLYKLIINFPGESNFSEWIENHRFTYFLISILIEAALNALYFYNEFNIEDIIINEGSNFQVCKMDSTFGKTIFGILLGYKFIIILVMLIYLFIEWNLEDTKFDVKLTLITLYIDILSIIILALLDIINIYSYISYFLIRETVILILSISNYGILYGTKLIIALLCKKDVRMTYINSVSKNFITNDSVTGKVKSTQFNDSSYITTTSNIQSNYIEAGVISSSNNDAKSNKTSIKTAKTSIISKMIDYHFTT